MQVWDNFLLRTGSFIHIRTGSSDQMVSSGIPDLISFPGLSSIFKKVVAPLEQYCIIFIFKLYSVEAL